jgi:hypothetical protein
MQKANPGRKPTIMLGAHIPDDQMDVPNNSREIESILCRVGVN